jgi:DNA-binding beta-propeller fold protein YncE
MRRGLRLAFVSLLAFLATACGGSAPPASIGPSTTSVPVSTAAEAGTPSATTALATPVPVPTGSPLGERLVATISVPAAPCAMAVDASSVWITGSATGELVRVDPLTNAVADKFAIGSGPCGIAVGPDGRIWVALLGAGSVVAADPATSKITARLDAVGPQLWDLKAGFGSIWVSDRNAHAVLRIDPKDATITATIPVGPQPSGLAVMAAGVWVSDDTDGMLRRIDPATNKVAATATAAGAPSWFADDGATHLLISERGGGNVLTVDPTTGALGDPLTGWNGPLDGTVLGGSAWIPEGGARRVGVVDLGAPGSAVVRYALPGAINPFVAEPAFGDVWVLDYGGTSIWRIRP